MGVLSYFRVSGVDYDWSDESVSVKADIHNYWTPRWDYGASDELHQRRQQNASDHSRGRAAAHAVQEVQAARAPRAGEETPADEIRRLLDPAASLTPPTNPRWRR